MDEQGKDLFPMNEQDALDVMKEFNKEYFKKNPNHSTVHMKFDACHAVLLMCSELLMGYMRLLQKTGEGLDADQVKSLCGVLAFMEVFLNTEDTLTNISGETLLESWAQESVKMSKVLKTVLVKVED